MELGLRQVHLKGIARYRFSKQTHYQTTGKTYTKKMLEDDLVLLKKQPETAWLAQMDSQSLQQAIADLEKAYRGFFDKIKKLPQFKKKGRSEESFRIPQRVYVKGRHLIVPKLGEIRLRLSQPVTLPTKSATFKLDALGHWYVTLTTQLEINELPEVPDFSEVEGFDLGLSALVVTSAGEKIEAPKYYRKAENKIATANRSLSRKKRHGRNYAKQRRKLAKVHAKVAAQRRELIHRLTRLATTWYKGICLEDLCVKGLARTKLAKSILDAAFGEIRRQLEYKGKWYGCHVQAINRWYASSKTCSQCGVLNEKLSLSERVWTCVCGITHDRDVNAAINIKREGDKKMQQEQHRRSDGLSKLACGATVRPLDQRRVAMKQESHPL
jgi:putative transposase